MERTIPNRLFKMVLAAVLVIVGTTVVYYGESIRQLGADQAVRPVIHTYYESYKNGQTKMETGDVVLLKTWNTAWQMAGWEPKILDEEDAKKHPDYEKLMNIIRDKQAPGENCVGRYDMACYKRWIAMAAVGGGVMSDYDVFPMNDIRHFGKKLPNDGKLSVWQRWVPALVTGSGEEYSRIAKRIAEVMADYIDKYHAGEETARNKCGSDMLSLVALGHKNNPEYIQSETIIAPSAITNWTETDCKKYKSAWGVHFSHSSLHAMGSNVNIRGYTAFDFTSEYRKKCKAVNGEKLIPPPEDINGEKLNLPMENLLEVS